MRTAQANLARRRQNAFSLGQQRAYRVPASAPILGWNTRDGANEVKPEECYAVQNFTPEVGGLRVRDGYQSLYEGSGAMYSLLVWSSGTAEKLLAATQTTLFEVNGSASVSSLNSGYWSGKMMNDRLGMVNGYDSPKYFDGTTIADMSISSHPDPTRIKGIHVHKSRSYFWDEGLYFWYSATNALGGVLTKFPLVTVAQRGGAVISINSWTRDGGQGPDDFLVITTTKGEVIVYAGSNPSDPDDFALVGRYFIGEPISQRCFLELDGKLHVLTKSDLETLPDRFLRNTTPPTKLSGAIRTAYENGKQWSHWQLIFDPVKQLIIANVPIGESTAEQYVMAPRGFTRWTRMNAHAWASFNGNLCWTGLGREPNYILVNNIDLLLWSASPLDLLAWTDAAYTTNHHIWKMNGNSDNGDFIFFDCSTGYSGLRTAQEKRVTMYRPLLLSTGTISISTELAYDYSGQYKGLQAFEEYAIGTPWGSEWDSEWQTVDQSRGQWFVGHGTGQTVSIRLRGLTKIPVQWAQTDWEIAPGGKY